MVDPEDPTPPRSGNEREYSSQWAAIVSIAEKIGCTAETLRKWVRQVEIDTGRRGGLTSDEHQSTRRVDIRYSI